MMKRQLKIVVILIASLFVISCSDINADTNNPQTRNFKYLALGDSYTIGQSVCETCRFPIQLQDSIKKYIGVNDTFQTKIIAQTGWTTTNLKAAIANQIPSNDYDIVTLLVGVNNQYQNMPVAVYEQEFPELVATAISKVKGKKENLIVVSIPDYAFTPFGGGNASISSQIDTYNNIAQAFCNANNIKFVNITDITRQGLTQTNLVANDGLHPSIIAYGKFVERILPKAKVVLGL